MTSRIPPSRRSPEFAVQRAAKVVAQQTPGAGRVAGAAKPGVSQAVAAALRGKPTVQVSTSALLATVGTTTPSSPGAGALWVDTTTTFYDTFDRPTSFVLGNGWEREPATGTWSIHSSGRLAGSGTGGVAGYSWCLQPFYKGDIDIQADVAISGPSSVFGLAWNVQTDGQGYAALCDASVGNVDFYRYDIDAGTFTLIAAATPGFTSPLTLRVTRVGNLHTIYLNGVSIHSVTNSVLPGTGRFGVTSGSPTTTYFDNYTSNVPAGPKLRVWDGTYWIYV